MTCEPLVITMNVFAEVENSGTPGYISRANLLVYYSKTGMCAAQ